MAVVARRPLHGLRIIAEPGLEEHDARPRMITGMEAGDLHAQCIQTVRQGEKSCTGRRNEPSTQASRSGPSLSACSTRHTATSQ